MRATLYTRTIHTRIRIITGIFLLLFLVVILRLFQLQVLSGAKYRAQVDNQYAPRKSGTIANRGTIFFVDAQGVRSTAAGQDITYQLAIDPKLIQDPQSVYQLIITAPDIPVISSDEWNNAVSQTKRITVPITEVPKTTADWIRKQKITGVAVIEERTRSYPGRSRSAQVIGFLGYKGDVLGGQYGLEKQYEAVLSDANTQLYRNFFADMFSDVRSLVHEDSLSIGAGDLITTIDPYVQETVEAQLDDIIKKWSPDEAGIIILDPHTGAVIAMASRPTFDLNEFRTVPNTAVYTNPNVQRSYEMGSIMKPLIMAFGFQKGVVTPNTIYTDNGNVVVGDRTIWNFDKKSRGVVNMETVLIQSLNTGMVHIMNKLDRTEVHEYLSSLGFGEKTGIDLPYEAKGLVSNLDSHRAVEYANVSFGQGIALTPIQMARALSVLANGGKLVTPYVVDHIEYAIGPDTTQKRPQPVSVLDPSAVEQVARIMTKLVDTNFGTNGVAIPHYNVAAKTGTAQVASPTGGYYEDRRLHSFFGFFPSYQPRYSVFMYMVHPKGAQYSSQTLSRPFLDITQAMINYYNIPPDRGIQ